ncbi:Cytochrome B561 [Rhodovastum atsumiense]|uniref:Cytochrome b n=1 Tax=Rhodovastum atsumiense TaxID=504468 RepID=A0A5M6ITH1_9PROT|nr:cytochrome b [Rhodovastum atsumiense]KAA5610745.1 cytochrome b [Rhodovastum atsumiense]CAH2604380.1 Cytochrome B561 [Rhodovastum atsumiense]
MLEGYSREQRLIHWTVAGLVVAQILIGISLAKLLQSSPENADELSRMLGLHGGTGTLLFVLMAWRLSLRRRLGVPPPPEGTPEDVSTLARLNHLTFYVLLLAMPIVGWLAASASGQQLSVFGLVHLPALIGKNQDVAAALTRMHVASGYLLICLIGLHLMGVVYHTYMRRDGLLRRMTG